MPAKKNVGGRWATRGAAGAVVMAIGDAAFAQQSLVTITVANLTQGVPRTQGNIQARPGDVIEARVYVSLVGTPAYALAGFNYEPGVSGWRDGVDTLLPIDNFNANTGSMSNMPDGQGMTGRHAPYNSAMIATAGNITGFTSFSPGDLRIAGSKATTMSLANMMISSGSTHAPCAGVTCPAPPGIVMLHLFSMRVTVGPLSLPGETSRSMSFTVFRTGFGTAASSQGVARWWLSVADGSAANYPVHVLASTVTIVPGPAAVVLAAWAGAFGCRRRR